MMTVFNFKGRVRAGYLTAFMLLLFSYSLTFYTTWQLSNQNKILNHTNDVIQKLEELHSCIKDATIGIRGYVIMKDMKYLLPYYSSKGNVDSLYRTILILTSDNSLQQERLVLLHALIKKKFAIADSALEAFNQQGFAQDLIETSTLESKKNSDSIRKVIGWLQNRENIQQMTRAQDVRYSSKAIKFVNITSLVVAILLVIYSVITFNIENRAKQEADNRAASYRRQLEERIFELNKLNKELEELKSMEKLAITGRIARAIAHEVRNPLTNIWLASEQLQSETSFANQANTYLEMINRNVQRINQLITDLLNSSKFSELRYEQVSINTVLDDALELARDRATLKEIRVQKKYAANIPLVSIDPEKMKIALLNIMVNAMEAMPDGKGELDIKTEKNSDKCVVTISDNGIGMDKETISKLFEPYFTSKIKGSGLGLTHAQNIIFNHKGSIDVKSELGKGSSFIISLHFT
jgi:signal transduction histidine kinase